MRAMESVGRTRRNAKVPSAGSGQHLRFAQEQNSGIFAGRTVGVAAVGVLRLRAAALRLQRFAQDDKA